jgi:glycogen debranching enzyme
MAVPRVTRPPGTVVFADYTVVASQPSGLIDGERAGVFDYDARILSRYQLTIDGESPRAIWQAQPEPERFVSRFELRLSGGTIEGPQLPEDAIEVQLERTVSSGVLDRWTFRSWAGLPWSGTAHLELDADFVDLAEVVRERRHEGTLTRHVGEAALELRYTAENDGRSLERGVRITVCRAGGPAAPTPAARIHETAIAVPLRLAPGESTSFEIEIASLVGGQWRSPRAGPESADEGTRREEWRRGRTRLEGPDRLRLPFERAVEDLYALRNRDLERDLLGGANRGWVVNAGVPTYTGFFGRDGLTTGWQSALAGTAALQGAIELAAERQATDPDPWRDAEPGKMLHEIRRGPLAELGLVPQEAYYGGQTTPAMFVITLSELWHWTGDDDILRRHRDAAVRAIEWAERSAQRGGGFLGYEQRSREGLRNQGWKDSDEAIRHADGRIAEPPIAPVEEQALHFLALQRLAEILVALDEPNEVDGLLQRAADLRARWHPAYWMPREGFYAMALEGEGRQVESVASNPGHALFTGIVEPDHAKAIADRLLSPSLFNGWGVRTLAEDHPSYNPLSYHLGTVWPVENATFALGLKRYGLDDHLATLADALLEAAWQLPDGRLPEALTGHRREPGFGPIPYPNANVPQAWSASALVHLVQVMLGLYPFAPLGVLAVVRPHLPTWLPELTLWNVRVGRAQVAIRFTRRPDGSASHEVLSESGSLLVVPAPPLQAGAIAAGGWIERLALQASPPMPGRLLRAARIATGLTD